MNKSDEMDSYPMPAVGALVYNGRRQILLIRTHKWGNRWGVPGGKVERGEKCEEALAREVRMQAGLEIKTPVFLFAQDCIDCKEFYKQAHFVILFYRSRSKSSEVRLNEEGEEYRWLSVEEALKLNLNQPTRELLFSEAKWTKSIRMKMVL